MLTVTRSKLLTLSSLNLFIFKMGAVKLIPPYRAVVENDKGILGKVCGMVLGTQATQWVLVLPLA